MKKKALTFVKLVIQPTNQNSSEHPWTPRASELRLVGPAPGLQYGKADKGP